MSLFTPDLYRNFGIGFGVGAVAVLLTNGSEWLAAVPQLVASILFEAFEGCTVVTYGLIP